MTRAADGGKRIVCPLHGEQLQTLVCAHTVQSLTDRVARGYHVAPARPELPEVFCDACEARLVSDGANWTAEAAQEVGVTALCSRCCSIVHGVNKMPDDPAGDTVPDRSPVANAGAGCIAAVLASVVPFVLLLVFGVMLAGSPNARHIFSIVGVLSLLSFVGIGVVVAKNGGDRSLFVFLVGSFALAGTMFWFLTSVLHNVRIW